MVRIFIKFSLTSGISDIKIGLKSGNPKEDVLLYGGSGMRCIPHILNNAFRPKYRTKFSDYAVKPYSIGISANGEI
ncbi:hypothetical protein [Roseburia intestinalis]|jgi:hypothetical protein|uniref:Uncharacterized protein n=1 Tax=Roseburia intestinalis TaxID=166486 RepID=A0A413YS09_9FIRM|nr:hypothetical protein [Roseburia intestinalis]RHC11852.1 hypothetical protein DW856_19720 [Roseburia intestinalis]RHG24023.1 hypothetical protein DW264_18630 [Roseburia intestinalis]